MARMSKAKAAERAEAIEQLRAWIKPGDTVYTILDHVSSSGMSRAIRVVVPQVRYAYDTDNAGPLDMVQGTVAGVDFIHPNYAIGQALGLNHWRRNGREQDALVVGGCGMDMGFHLVYELSSVLYGGRADGSGGYQCLGKGKCPSNYHTNHRDRLRCEGTREHNPDGPDWGGYCHRPSKWYGEEIPEGWPMLRRDVGDGQTIAIPASCITVDREGHEIAPVICPTCGGVGDVPNPEGPERFDLVHTDGYALRHRWL